MKPAKPRTAPRKPTARAKPKKIKVPDFMARLEKKFPNEQMAPAGTIQAIIDYDRGER